MPTSLNSRNFGLFNVRIYYEDTDSGGVVYYANYLKFAERARTEWLRELGFDHTSLLQENGIMFVVRNVNCEFIRPAKLDDLLTIETLLTDIGRVSMRMRQVIKRQEETLSQLDVKLGIIGANFQPVRLPEPIRIALTACPTTPSAL